MIQTVLFASRAMGEWNMIVRNIVEEMNLLLLEHQSRGDGMDRCIAPALVEETACMVQRGEIVDVSIGSKPVQVANLKVGPEMAMVVGLSVIVAEPLHRVALDNVLRVSRCEILDGVPESGDCLDVLVQAEGEAVLLLVLGHELESVIFDVAEELDTGLNAPVPLIVHHQRVAEEKARFITAHVPVTDGVAVDDLLLLHLLTDLGGLVLVNPLGEGPMLLGDLAILCLARNQRGGDLYELVVEIVVVKKDPVVVELAVEAVLDVTDRFGNLPDVRVTGKRYEGRVHAIALGCGRGKLSAGVRCCRGRLLFSCGRCWRVGIHDALALVALGRGPLWRGNRR